MNILSISMNKFNRTKQNFNGKFEVTNDAKKLIDRICPADELIKSVQDVCSQNTVDFLIKLEKASKRELDKLITGFQISAYKGGKILPEKAFIPAKTPQDIECLIATTDEVYRKLSK